MALRRSPFALSVSLLLFSGCAVIPREEEAIWNEAFPTLTPHLVMEFRGGYQAAPADIDGDGLVDIVALATGASGLVWYRNPTWEAYPILTETARFINVAPYDVNGDGRLDLVLASEFSLGNSNEGGLVHWAEAPLDPTHPDSWSWTIHPIDAVPTSHRLRWADIDGDGEQELVNLPIIGVGAAAPEYLGAAELISYEIPADPRGPWEARVLEGDLLELAHGLETIDWDGDGIDDLLTASSVGVTLFRMGSEGRPVEVTQVGEGKVAPAPNRGSSEIGVGSLGPEGRFVAAVEPWHGAEVVVYTPPEDGSFPWTRTVIETEVTGGHALITADFNGDGYDEIVAGGRSGNRALLLFRYRPLDRSWERIPLDMGGIAVSSLAVADFNGDGLPDLLALGSGTNNVVWFENHPLP